MYKDYYTQQFIDAMKSVQINPMNYALSVGQLVRLKLQKQEIRDVCPACNVFAQINCILLIVYDAVNHWVLFAQKNKYFQAKDHNVLHVYLHAQTADGPN